MVEGKEKKRSSELSRHKHTNRAREKTEYVTRFGPQHGIK
jgi:hypothetical protein